MAATSGTSPRKKGAMGKPVTWVIVLGIGLAAGAYLLYRRSKASSASSTTATVTPDTQDFSGQISTLQAEVADLQGKVAQDTGTDETGEGAGSPGGGSGGGTSGGGGKPPKGGHVPAMPAHVSGAAASPEAIRLSWAKVPGATSYRAHVTYQGKKLPSVSTQSTSVTISGLSPNRTYTAHVSACNASGCSSETNGPVVHTTRLRRGNPPGTGKAA